MCVNFFLNPFQRRLVSKTAVEIEATDHIGFPPRQSANDLERCRFLCGVSFFKMLRKIKASQEMWSGVMRHEARIVALASGGDD